MIITTRLRLVPATREIASAEVSDRARLSVLLGARIPIDWPPPFNDAVSARWILDQLNADLNNVGWLAWYFISDRDPDRVAIGNGGFKGPPAGGTVEVGYSLLPEFHRRGYAFEAVGALIDWAFGDLRVEHVVAETLPELIASQGLLRKLGFDEGASSQPGILRFEMSRNSRTRSRPADDDRVR